MKLVLVVVQFQVLLLFRGVIARVPTEVENTVRPKEIVRDNGDPAEFDKTMAKSKQCLEDEKHNKLPTWGADEQTDTERETKWMAIDQTGCSSTITKEKLIAARTVIIIVDFQNDFLEDYEQATMKVPGSHKASETIKKILTEFKDKKGTKLVVTQDAHPQNHFSFAINWKEMRDTNKEEIMPSFGYSLANKAKEAAVIRTFWPEKFYVWPTHCVIGTEGFKIHSALEAFIYHSGFEVTTVYKAVYPQRESYSGFVDYDKDEQKNENYVNLWEYFESKKNEVDNIEVDNIVVVGLAFEYCVTATAIHAVKALRYNAPASHKKVIIVSHACGYLSEVGKTQRQGVCSNLTSRGVAVVNSVEFI